MITTQEIVPKIWCIVRKNDSQEEYWNGKTFGKAFGLAEAYTSREEAEERLRQIRRRVNGSG